MNREPGVAIRPGRPRDRDPVERLLEDEDLEATFVPAEFLVAEDGDEVVGCARLAPVSGDVVELASVAVVPDRRGEGIGSRLVRAQLDRADGPVQAVCLESAFFERLGFAAVDRVHPRIEAKAGACCADRDTVAMAWRPEQ